MKTLLAFLLLLAAPLAAQTIAPSQIKPGTDGQVLKTTGGKAAWGSSGASVSSVFGRIGNVTAQPGDYNCSQITSAICSLPSLFNQTVEVDGAAKMQRSSLNFINGSAGTVSCVDNPVTLATDCTFTGGSSTGITYSIADVSGSKSFNVTYQNTSSAPLFIGGSAVTFLGSRTARTTVSQGPTAFSLPFTNWDAMFGATVNTAGGGNAGFSAVIMPGYYYRVSASGDITGTAKWVEISSTGSGGGGGSGPALQTNGTPNASQALLNLKAGTNVTLTNSGGDVTINASGGSGGTAGGALAGTYPNPTIANMSVAAGLIPMTDGSGNLTPSGASTDTFGNINILSSYSTGHDGLGLYVRNTACTSSSMAGSEYDDGDITKALLIGRNSSCWTGTDVTSADADIIYAKGAGVLWIGPQSSSGEIHLLQSAGGADYIKMTNASKTSTGVFLPSLGAGLLATTSAGEMTPATTAQQTITVNSTACVLGSACTISGSGSAFSAITSGTNTAAAMLVGTGASLGVTGTGTINANKVNGAVVPTTGTLTQSNGSGQLVSSDLALTQATLPGGGGQLVDVFNLASSRSPFFNGEVFIGPSAGGCALPGLGSPVLLAMCGTTSTSDGVGTYLSNAYTGARSVEYDAFNDVSGHGLVMGMNGSAAGGTGIGASDIAYIGTEDVPLRIGGSLVGFSEPLWLVGGNDLNPSITLNGSQAVILPGVATSPSTTPICPNGTGGALTTVGCAGGTGTVTSIATTSPITGGPITSTGTIACATCVVASSPGAGLARFAGSTQTVTSSELSGDATTSGSNAVTVVKVNGASLPTSKNFVGTNSSGQIVAALIPWSCQPGFGDGLNAITAGTYLQSTCYNDTGQTVTLTGIKCFADAGSPTLAVTNGAGTALLTGAVTCTTSFAAGTQSGTTTIASGDFLKFTFVDSASTKQSSWVVTGTHP